MKIELMGKPEIIMSNPHSSHNYFAWPTTVKLQNGKIAVVASGFRRRHICPFGKTVISYSEDNGKTYTAPAPIIDTVLDDRDGGILPFGESNVIVTSFNNSTEFQRENSELTAYDSAYLDTVTPEAEAEALGVNFRISSDCGVTFGKIFKSPVTSPHGPAELKDGTVLWAGNNFHDFNGGIEVIRINTENGETEPVGKITVDDKETVLCEPHMLELPDGKLICHIRGEGKGLFTVFQSISTDKGKTWSKPEMLLDETGGAPPHLIRLSSGILLSTYGRRKMPYGIMAMISLDGGKSWKKDIRIYENLVSDDLGYPSTVELDDRSLLTVFYACTSEDGPCRILQQKWKLHG